MLADFQGDGRVCVSTAVQQQPFCSLLLAAFLQAA